MTRSTHEHQWVYLGDLLLVVRKEETDVSNRRAEYCYGCSTLRVQFPSGWYDVRGEATKKYLSLFDGEASGKVYDFAPKGFRPRAPKSSPKRLGRGLLDLITWPAPSSPFKR